MMRCVYYTEEFFLEMMMCVFLEPENPVPMPKENGDVTGERHVPNLLGKQLRREEHKRHIRPAERRSNYACRYHHQNSWKDRRTNTRTDTVAKHYFKHSHLAQSYHVLGNSFKIFLSMGSRDMNNDEMKRAPVWLSQELLLGGLNRVQRGQKLPKIKIDGVFL